MRKFALISSVLVFVAVSSVGCEGEGPTEPSSNSAFPVLASKESLKNGGQKKVEICHRTQGLTTFLVILVAEPSVDSHLAHGDGLIGEAVPGQPGLVFNSDCEPIPSRRVITVSGQWTGTRYVFYGLFTVAYRGPVDAVATVNGYSGLLRLGLLGYKPGEPSSCSTYWLPEPIPSGPSMETPTITAHWDEVPPGTYCLNVVSGVPVPPYPPPYSWTVTISYP